MEIFRPVLKKILYKNKVFFERALPQEGEIYCKVGDTVQPFDVLGSTFISTDKRLWRVTSSDWVINVKDGQSLNSGDVLARKKALLPFKKEVMRMPFSGAVSLLVEDGITRIDILSFPEKNNLVAGISGRVVKMAQKRSILLETKAYIINGVFGSGREVFGEIKVVGTFDSPLLLSQMTPDLSGKILVGGSYVAPEVVNKAQVLGVVALVVGGTNLQPPRSNFPVLATEGFGRIPMNKQVWQFFQSEQLKTAVVAPQRRQVIIPSSQGDRLNLGDSAHQTRPLKKNDLVQVFVWPNFGFCGQVIEIGREKSFLASGVEDFLVKVKFENGETADVPVSNLGILE